MLVVVVVVVEEGRTIVEVAEGVEAGTEAGQIPTIVELLELEAGTVVGTVTGAEVVRD